MAGPHLLAFPEPLPSPSTPCCCCPRSPVFLAMKSCKLCDVPIVPWHINRVGANLRFQNKHGSLTTSTASGKLTSKRPYQQIQAEGKLPAGQLRPALHGLGGIETFGAWRVLVSMGCEVGGARPRDPESCWERPVLFPAGNGGGGGGRGAEGF